MATPYFVKAATSKMWHVVFPGEERPVCGTKAALDDVSGGFDLPGSEVVCATCQWNKRLRNENVRVAAYYPEFACTACGAIVDIEQRWPHYHRTIRGTDDG